MDADLLAVNPNPIQAPETPADLGDHGDPWRDAQGPFTSGRQQILTPQPCEDDKRSNTCWQAPDVCDKVSFRERRRSYAAL